MSQLSAHIVYATFKALGEEEKEKFVQLIEEERKTYKRKPRRVPKVHDKLHPKFHPDNYEMLVAEFMHPK